MSDEIKILVCTHKPWDLPKGDIYLPIQAGKAVSDIDLGILGDNTGDNISEKNKNFCELTVLYWAWKNIKKLYPNLEYIGLCHYRRFFVFDKELNNTPHIQQNSLKIENRIKKDLSKHHIILPIRSTYPYSLKMDYCINHSKSDFDALRDIICKEKSQHLVSFDKIMNRTNKFSYCNMFMANFRVFDEYCSWLFSILFELEKRIDLKFYDPFQARIFGFMAERLLNVFAYHHTLSPKYYPTLYFDGINNYIRKESYREIIKDNLMFFVTEILDRIL